MEMTQFLGQVASTGIVGVLLVIALLTLRAKDRELSEEKDARIKDAKDWNTQALTIQKEVSDSLAKLSEIFKIWEKREQERERERGRRP